METVDLGSSSPSSESKVPSFHDLARKRREVLRDKKKAAANNAGNASNLKSEERKDTYQQRDLKGQHFAGSQDQVFTITGATLTDNAQPSFSDNNKQTTQQRTSILHSPDCLDSSHKNLKKKLRWKEQGNVEEEDDGMREPEPSSPSRGSAAYVSLGASHESDEVFTIIEGETFFR